MTTHLKRTLGPVMLWGLGVGYVISGEYFGWNLGLPVAGTYGMLAATLLVTVMYAGFVLAYAELACAIPHAGGAADYADRAFGPQVGFFAAIFQLVEFVFAPPAIAAAIGAYLNLYFPSVPPLAIAIAAYFVFTALNAWGVKQAATFELFVTVLAVIELLIFCAVTAPHFDLAKFNEDALPHGWSGAFEAIPFAIWFYLAIEGVANAAEEARNPQRDISIGFGGAIGTLVLLALGVFFCATGVAGWRAIVYPSPGADPSDSPLPLAIAFAVTKSSPFYHLIVGVGLLGLVASFHGILLAAGRATMHLGRVGHAPDWLAAVHPTRATPSRALVVNFVIGTIALLTGKTAQIITLSCFGAIALYLIAFASFFKLRKMRPDMERPFRAPGFPLFQIVSAAIAVVCAVALAWFNATIALIFCALIGLAWIARKVGTRAAAS